MLIRMNEAQNSVSRNTHNGEAANLMSWEVESEDQKSSSLATEGVQQYPVCVELHESLCQEKTKWPMAGKQMTLFSDSLDFLRCLHLMIFQLEWYTSQACWVKSTF